MPSAGPRVPTEVQVKAHPRLAYQLFFDKQTSAATDELDRDIRRTLRGTLRDVASPPPESFLTSPDTFIGAWDGVDEVCFSVWRVHVSANLYLSDSSHPILLERRGGLLG